MERELDAFLAIGKELVAEKLREIKQLRRMCDRESRNAIKERGELLGALTSFLLTIAWLVKNGIPVLDAMAAIMSRCDEEGEPYLIGMTKACCGEVMQRYMSLEGKLE